MRARGAMSGEPGNRTKLVAALFAAVALLAAVVVLRGQVEPARPAAAPTDEPAVTQRQSLPLPVRPNRREIEWRHYALPLGAMQVLADRSHLTVLQDRPAGQPAGVNLVMLRRDTSEQVITYPTTEHWWPSQWALHGDGLLVMEQRASLDGQPPRRGAIFRLRWLQLGTQAVRELPVRSVQALRLDGMHSAGEDVLVVGSTESPAQTCVVAVRPSTGADRAVQCQSGHNRAVWFVNDGSDLRWMFSGASGMCDQWFELAADGSARAVRDAPRCSDALEVSIGGWTVGIDDHGAQQLRLRARGPDGERLTLDESGFPGIACGRHYYWASVVRNEPRIMRWRPGTDHTHVALAIAGSGVPELRPDGCVDGVLTTSVTLPPTDGRATMEAWVLDRP